MLNRTLNRFHQEVIDLDIPENPARLSDRRKAWAVSAFEEETKEFRDAEELADDSVGNAPATEKDILLDELDACIDLAYFALGRPDEMGFNIDRAWSNVQYSNMLKRRGMVVSRPLGDGGDAAKPERWRPPNHENSGRSRICVIGDGRSGKDTVAQMICERFPGYQFASSSWFALNHFLWDMWGKDYFPDKQACFAERSLHRMSWRATIRKWLDGDEGKLGRELFQHYDIYCGCRAVEEMCGMMREGLVDLIIWVERPGVPPDSSNALTAEFADVILSNDGSYLDLKMQVDRIEGIRPGILPA